MQHETDNPSDMGALLRKLMREQNMKPYVAATQPLRPGAWKSGTSDTITHLLAMLSFINLVNGNYDVTRKLSIALCFNPKMSWRWKPMVNAFKGSTIFIVSWLGVTFSISRFDLDGVMDAYALLRVTLAEQVYPAAADFVAFHEQHAREHASHLSPFSPKPPSHLN